jgi:hypothetical protein
MKGKLNPYPLRAQADQTVSRIKITAILEKRIAGRFVAELQASGTCNAK